MNCRSLTPEQKLICREVRDALGNIMNRINKLGQVFNGTPTRNDKIEKNDRTDRNDRNDKQLKSNDQSRLRNSQRSYFNNSVQENNDVFKRMQLIDEIIKESQIRTRKLIEDRESCHPITHRMM